MLKLRLFISCTVIAAGLSLSGNRAEVVAEEHFTLARVIPHDVFLFESCRRNPERAFLDRYWDDVFDALRQSGIDENLAELFGTMLGLSSEQNDEIDRLKERFSELIAGVDWKQLQGSENVFAERFSPLGRITDQQPIIVTASLVWLSHGRGEAPRQNYDGLVAILETLVKETNEALGSEALKVKRGTQMGAQVASVNLLAAAPGAPALPLSVAIRDDMVLIALREDLLHDVLSLMAKDSTKKSLADNPRFVAAFDQLPPATDSMFFFSMQDLLRPLRNSADVLLKTVEDPGDVYRNIGINAQASKLNEKAMSAYRRGDIKQALASVQEAHQVEPDDAIILYNLACFNALLGNQDKALDWLERAVEGGFYAPRKIAKDPDLKSLRDTPRYQQALDQAARSARECCADDMCLNYSDSGDVRRLRMQVHQAYLKKDYDQALELNEQALAVAPNDSKVLYAMGCLHTLKGHKDKGLEFLQQAVEGGFYCPTLISKDPDWDRVRTDPRYQRALATAEKMAAAATDSKRAARAQLIRHLIERQAEAAAAVEYSAAVETTDGHAVWKETITTLVPDAQDRPIYPVFGQRQQLHDFSRYLPQETAAFSISSGLNVRELYRFVEDSFRGGGPLGEELLATWKAMQERIGLDVKHDVIGLFEGETISVTLADGGGTVHLVKVADEEKAYQQLDHVLTALPEWVTKAISQKPAMGGLAAFGVKSSPLTHEQLDGFQSINIAVSPQPIGVWGTADGYLVFGSSAEAVALCLATSKNEHTNIRSNATAISEAIVPDGPFVSMSLTNRRTTSSEIATAMGAASMMGGMVAASIPQPELRPVITQVTRIMGKLAPVVRKVDFYKSAAGITTFDGKTWRNRSVTHYQSPSERTKTQNGHSATTDDS